MSVATERKLVTVLFCDLVGSTTLGELLDVEALGSVQAAYFDRMRSVVEQFGGTVEKFAGDAVVAVFGVPAQHEDDAERAVRCALALREALVGLTDTLHTAARLEQAAEPAEVLVSRDTMRLTSDAFDYGAEVQVDAKGKRGPVSAWPAVAGTSRRTRARSPLVGRTAELEVLAGALERAIRDGEPQALVVLGEPGIGKSRLAEEFAGRARTDAPASSAEPACPTARAPYGCRSPGSSARRPGSGTRTARKRPARSCTGRWRRATAPRSSRSSRRSWPRWSRGRRRARRTSSSGAYAAT